MERPAAAHAATIVAPSGGLKDTAKPDVADTALDDRVGGSRREPEAITAPLEGRIGHYLPLHKLGAGGMGAVYAAYDTKLDRKVAIKVLLARGSELARQRLVREAQAMAQLSHPNIAQVYEIGEIEASGDAYLVMEYVDGVTLHTWLEGDANRDPAAVLEVFIAAGRGLAAAHAEGLVHRDFKPDNVMIRRDDRVLVMDFGLARGWIPNGGDAAAPRVAASGVHDAGDLGISRASFSELSTELTATGAVLGTPAYMAPEQFCGLEADARADQFAFCVALFEALHRRRPFAGETAYELMAAVTEGAWLRPERSELDWVDAILGRGLAVDPDARWPSMDALLDALSRDPTPRRRLLMGLGGALVALSVAACGLWIAEERDRAQTRARCESLGSAFPRAWEGQRDTYADRFAASDSPIAAQVWGKVEPVLGDYVDDWAAMREQACVEAEVDEALPAQSYAQVVRCLDEARETFAGLTGAWTTIDTPKVIQASRGVAGLPPLTLCRDEARLELRRSPPPDKAEAIDAIESRLVHAYGLSLAGDFGAAKEELDRVAVEAEAVGWSPLVAEVLRRRANVQGSLGEYEAAVRDGERSLFAAVEGGDDILALEATIDLIDITGSYLGEPEGGRRWHELAQAMLRRLDIRGGRLESRLLRHRGRLLFVEGRSEEAIAPALRSLALDEELYGPKSVVVSGALNSLGNIYWQAGRYDEALATHGRALAIRRELFGTDHPMVSNSLNNIGLVQWKRGDFDAAANAHQEALRIRERAFARDHVDVGSSLNNLGLIYLEHERYDDARREFERALAIWSAALGPEHADLALVHNNLGLIANEQRRHDEALRELERAREIRIAALGPEHSDVGTSEMNIGLVHYTSENHEAALAAFARGESILAGLPEDHPERLRNQLLIAKVDIARENWPEARGRLEQTRAIYEANCDTESRGFVDLLVALAEVAFAERAYEEARAMLERVTQIHRELGAVPALMASDDYLLGRVLVALGERDEGRALVEGAREVFVTLGRTDDIAEIDGWIAEH